ncbi:MAG TPA: gamma-glutamylcyclotransferase family protein [Caulobacteraceae bacterium]|nr:gamma-glutamylcyclotransferase family protein [Caulobacteraceae bacterium]
MRLSGEHRLATYGSLSPGAAHHDQLARLKGRWTEGAVRGRVAPMRSGPARGYLGLTLGGPAHTAVKLFESADLPRHWRRLDAFEGRAYRRVTVKVRTAKGDMDAQIYVAV